MPSLQILKEKVCKLLHLLHALDKLNEKEFMIKLCENSPVVHVTTDSRVNKPWYIGNDYHNTILMLLVETKNLPWVTTVGLFSSI